MIRRSPEEIRKAVDGALELLFQDAIKGPHLHPRPKPDNVAPDGFLWQCGACGKKVKDKFSDNGEWDESCMLNAVLIKEDPTRE